MKSIKRLVPQGEIQEATLKNYSFNNKGQLFLIFEINSQQENVLKENNSSDMLLFTKTPAGNTQELIINLSNEETKQLIQFMKKVEI